MYYVICLLICIAIAALAFLLEHNNKIGQARPSVSVERNEGIKHGTTEKIEKTARERFKNAKAYISPGRYGTEGHIKHRHWYNARSSPYTSHFDQTMTMQKLNVLATETLNKGNKRIGRNGRMIHQYHFQNRIGTARNGKPAYSLRVITDPQVSENQTVPVITAFPVN